MSNIKADLVRWLERRPLVLFRFDEKFSAQLWETQHGLARFTLTRPHSAIENMKVPTLCLAEIYREGQDRQTKLECYVGVLKSKAAVSTFDSRLAFFKLRQIDLHSFTAVSELVVEKRLKSILRGQLNRLQFSTVLSAKVSASIIAGLWKTQKNRWALEAASNDLPRFRQLSTGEWGQRDAIKLALAAFGLSASDKPEFAEVTHNSDSALRHVEGRLLEDNVIGADASAIPGFSLIRKTWTGHAVFAKGEERLEVYTANRGPLEKMFGVDLIYINLVLGSTVMVQYKMLEDTRTEQGDSPDWTFKPDKQLKVEMARMTIPTPTRRVNDYRLNRSPFYFKFIKRRPWDDSPHSLIVSSDHLSQLLKSRAMRGPKGGTRISYQALNGNYLRESDFVGLIRSGYIGTHRVESEALAPIIAAVANGDRALVMAWQKRISAAEWS